MKDNLKANHNNEIFKVKCKECSNRLTENISKERIEKILIKDKEYYAIRIVDFSFYLFGGKNKLFILSKESFLYDEISCISCKKRFGMQIKSCREQFLNYVNDYFIVKAKKVKL